MSHDAKSGLDRRQFLKLAAVSIPLALGTGHAIIERADGIEEKISLVTLLIRAYAGEFSQSQPDITSLDSVNNKFLETTAALPDITHAQLLISNGTDSKNIGYNQPPSYFYPGSTINVAICTEAASIEAKYDKQGQILTSERAFQILNHSNLLTDMIDDLPSDQPLTPAKHVHQILSQAGIQPLGKPGELPLCINSTEYFSYLIKTPLPSVIQQAMLQTPIDSLGTYGSAKIITDILGGQYSAYFKLGIIRHPQDHELYHSFFLRICKNDTDIINSLFFTKSDNLNSAHELALHTAALIANYSVYRQD